MSVSPDPESTKPTKPTEESKSAGHRPGWKPAALHSEPIHPAPIAAKLEDLEELFAPTTAPEDIEYGAQPPG